MSEATTADALRSAIELIEQDGWIQGNMHTTGGYCSLGAIRHGAQLALGDVDFAAVPVDEARDALTVLRENTDRFVRQVIRERYDIGSIVHWNDQPQRTREEVLGVLHEALARAES